MGLTSREGWYWRPYPGRVATSEGVRSPPPRYCLPPMVVWGNTKTTRKLPRCALLPSQLPHLAATSTMSCDRTTKSPATMSCPVSCHVTPPYRHISATSLVRTMTSSSHTCHITATSVPPRHTSVPRARGWHHANISKISRRKSDFHHFAEKARFCSFAVPLQCIKEVADLSDEKTSSGEGPQLTQKGRNDQFSSQSMRKGAETNFQRIQRPNNGH